MELESKVLDLKVEKDSELNTIICVNIGQTAPNVFTALQHKAVTGTDYVIVTLLHNNSNYINATAKSINTGTVVLFHHFG